MRKNVRPTEGIVDIERQESMVNNDLSASISVATEETSQNSSIEDVKMVT